VGEDGHEAADVLEGAVVGVEVVRAGGVVGELKEAQAVHAVGEDLELVGGGQSLEAAQALLQERGGLGGVRVQEDKGLVVLLVVGEEEAQRQLVGAEARRGGEGLRVGRADGLDKIAQAWFKRLFYAQVAKDRLSRFQLGLAGRSLVRHELLLEEVGLAADLGVWKEKKG